VNCKWSLTEESLEVTLKSFTVKWELERVQEFTDGIQVIKDSVGGFHGSLKRLQKISGSASCFK